MGGTVAHSKASSSANAAAAIGCERMVAALAWLHCGMRKSVLWMPAGKHQQKDTLC
jgi:hypothetical protein